MAGSFWDYRRRLTWQDAIYNYNVSVAALSRAVGMDVTQVRQAPDLGAAP